MYNFRTLIHRNTYLNGKIKYLRTYYFLFRVLVFKKYLFFFLLNFSYLQNFCNITNNEHHMVSK